MASDVTVPLEKLGDAFAVILDNYKEKIDKNNEKIVRKIGKETAEDLKQTSPKRNSGEKQYAEGWKSTLERDGYGSAIAHVHNTTKPGLTHLLELGHGGSDPAPAYPHIAPAGRRGIAKLEKEIKQ